MSKKEIGTLLACIIGILVLFPFIINSLMFFNVIPVKGDVTIWIPTLGTFWGAILGGLISGVLTLIGVRISVKSSFESIEKQRLEQVKNEEEVRYINQLPALIKIKFELSNMHESIENAEKQREQLREYLTDKRQTPDEVENEVIEKKYKMYLINDSNWSDIGLVQDVDFQSSLIDIKHLYLQVAESLSFDIVKAKLKLEQLEFEAFTNNDDYFNSVSLMELKEYELEIDEIIVNKKKAWENIEEKNLIKVFEDHIKIIEIAMESLQEFLNKRHEIRDRSNG